MTVHDLVAEPLRAAKAMQGDAAASARRRAARAGGSGHAASLAPSARVQRRPVPAHRHRPRAGAAARAAGARRAHLGPRRLGAGPHPHTAAPSPGASSCSRICSSPTTWQWSSPWPTRWPSCTSAGSSRAGRPTCSSATRGTPTRSRCSAACRRPTRSIARTRRRWPGTCRAPSILLRAAASTRAASSGWMSATSKLPTYVERQGRLIACHLPDDFDLSADQEAARIAMATRDDEDGGRRPDPAHEGQRRSPTPHIRRRW